MIAMEDEGHDLSSFLSVGLTGRLKGVCKNVCGVLA